MSRIEKIITVEAPLEDVYAQWTQFEEFPRFMEGVDRVVQIDDRTLRWTATVAGREKQWTARIVTRPPIPVSRGAASKVRRTTARSSSPEWMRARRRSGSSSTPIPRASLRRPATGWASSTAG